jgi:hypothetical protein
MESPTLIPPKRSHHTYGLGFADRTQSPAAERERVTIRRYPDDNFGPSDSTVGKELYG